MDPFFTIVNKCQQLKATSVLEKDTSMKAKEIYQHCHHIVIFIESKIPLNN